MVIGLLGIFVFCVGLIDAFNKDHDKDLDLLFTISFVSILVFGSLTIIKFKYANDLDSKSLYKDGICSLIGTCLSASLLLTTAIIDHAPNAWVLDPIVSVIIGIGATFYGSRTVVKRVKNGVPIFHPEWWYDKKEEEDTVRTQELPNVPDLEKSSSAEYEGGKAEDGPANEEAPVEHEVI